MEQSSLGHPTTHENVLGMEDVNMRRTRNNGTARFCLLTAAGTSASLGAQQVRGEALNAVACVSVIGTVVIGVSSKERLVQVLTDTAGLFTITVDRLVLVRALKSGLSPEAVGCRHSGDHSSEASCAVAHGGARSRA